MTTKPVGRPRIHEERDMVAIMTKVPRKVAQQLDELAKHTDRTRSGLVCYILKTQLQNPRMPL